MSGTHKCIRPIILKKEDVSFTTLSNIERMNYVNQVMPYQLDIELTSRCGGSCAYCFASSTIADDFTIPLEKAKEILNEGLDLGVKLLILIGGCPLAHPNWAEVVAYAAELGIHTYLDTSTLISKKDAAKICELRASYDTLGLTCVHIDTIDQDTYNQVHTNPQTLQQKIRGYHNLLSAGYPADRIVFCITMSKPALDKIEETVDWVVDEMGCRDICFVQFKEEGFGEQHPHWQPSLADIKRALEYRAKRLGQEWLRIGTMDSSIIHCRSAFHVLFDGSVVPCSSARDLSVGNIYQESLKDIFEKHRDFLLWNFEIEGYCGGECEHSDICFGCRTNAYHCLGDVRASDPKCPWNPGAVEPKDYIRVKL